jgi:putative ABC transport system permease protein
MALRNIARRKARSTLTVLGITVGIASMVFLMSMMEGLEVQVTSIMERGGADLLVLQRGSFDLMLSRLSESEVKGLQQVPGVEAISYSLFMVTKVENYPYFIVNGLRLGEFTIGHFDVVEGEGLTPADEGKILLGRKIASHLKKRPGDEIVLQGNRFEVAGIYETGLRFEDFGSVILLEGAQRVFDLEGFLSLVEVKVVDLASLEEVKASISRAFTNVEVNVPREVASKQEDLQLIRSAASGISLVAVLFGTIIITNTMIMSVYERTREIGILRALGWRKRSVLLMFLRETLALSLMGGASGIAMALAGTYLLENFTSTVIPMRTDLLHVVYGIGSAIALGVLGGAYPAVRAARMDPIEALGHEV